MGDSLQPGNAQALGDIVRQLRRPLRKTGSDLHAIAIQQDFSLVMERISHGCIPFAFSAVLRARTAREQCVLTLPSEQPMAAAVSATSISSQ